MAAVCAALASRQLSRSAGTRFSQISQIFQISRRGFITTPSLRAIESSGTSSSSDARIPTRPPAIKRGSLSSGSIFADADGDDMLDLSTTGRTPKRRQAPTQATQQGIPRDLTTDIETRDIANMERSLNPFPHRRARWQRKMIIRTIHRRGRLTRKEQIMQSERELSSQSHWFKTSVKKLGPLARQIAGKNIDEAILQMRFSKKKAAKDIKAFLEQAKNEAVVSRGMGLGQDAANETAEGEDPASSSAATAPPTSIKLKDGKFLRITDPTSIYISQAWVNRGPFDKEIAPRGRGRTHILRPPHTSISLVLKEEKTRIREWQEREAKNTRKRQAKVWRQLPDRPINMRNQYYAW